MGGRDTQITVYVTDERKAELKQRADEEDTSMSGIINDMIDRQIQQDAQDAIASEARAEERIQELISVGTELSQWVSDVSSELRRIADHHPEDTLVMLAGQDYLEPLEGDLAHLPNEIEYPFEDTGGIGEQMGWLKDQIKAAENCTASEQQDSGRTTLDAFE